MNRKDIFRKFADALHDEEFRAAAPETAEESHELDVASFAPEGGAQVEELPEDIFDLDELETEALSKRAFSDKLNVRDAIRYTFYSSVTPIKLRTQK